MARRSVDVVVQAHDRLSKQFGGMERATQGLARSLKFALGGALAYVTVRGIIRGVQDVTEAYGRQQKAEEGLRAALRNVSDEAERSFDRLRRFAAEMQRTTIYGDELIIEMMQLGAGIGKLSGEQLEQATVAAIGLSKAFGMDLTAAMRLVARAAVGDTATLKRYGIVLDQNMSSQEKFNAVLDIGRQNFSLAEAEAATFDGRMAQLSNTIGDLKERLGEALVPVLTSLAEKLMPVLVGYTEQLSAAIEKNQDKILEWAEVWSTDAVDGIKMVIQALAEMMSWMQQASGMLDTMLDSVLGPQARNKVQVVNPGRTLADAVRDRIERAGGFTPISRAGVLNRRLASGALDFGIDRPDRLRGGEAGRALLELGKRLGRGFLDAATGAGGTPALAAAGAMRRMGPVAAQESWFLTRGERVDHARSTAENTKQTNNLLKTAVNLLGMLADPERRDELQLAFANFTEAGA